MALEKLNYRNDSDEPVPPHAVLQLDGGTYDTGFGINKPGSSSGPYLIDNGKGAAMSGDGQYGTAHRAFEGAVWVAFDPTGTPPSVWGTVGPKSGEWFMSVDGTGYYYAGKHDEDNDLILVISKTGEAAENPPVPCGCCACFNCITVDQAPITTCTACAAAPTQYVVDVGTWAAWPTLGGNVVVTYDSDCTWLGEEIEVTDGVFDGTYQWVLIVGTPTTLELQFVTGTDIVFV